MTTQERWPKRLPGANRSAYGVACDHGYPYIDTGGGRMSPCGRYWQSCFRRRPSREGPSQRLFVGWDPQLGWVTEREGDEQTTPKA